MIEGDRSTKKYRESDIQKHRRERETTSMQEKYIEQVKERQKKQAGTSQHDHRSFSEKSVRIDEVDVSLKSGLSFKIKEDISKKKIEKDFRTEK